jgi:hypothetical protein
LLHPVTHSPADADRRERTAAAIARRLADRGRTEEAVAFAVSPVTGRPAVVAAAVACPDVYLIDARPAARHDLTVRIVEAAVRDGQRVAVISSAPDEMVEALACRSELVVTRALTEKEREERRRAVFDQLVMAEGLERVRAEEEDVRRQLSRITELAAERVERSDWYREAVATRDAATVARRAHLDRRTAAEREVEHLRVECAQPAGFLSRLFGGAAKATDARHKLDAAEATLRHLIETEPADPDPAFQAERQRRVAAEADAVRAELDDRLAQLVGERDRQPRPSADADTLRATLRDLDDGPSVEAKRRARVVVGPPSADADPLFAASHPEVSPAFDRLIVTDADALMDDEFDPLARLAAAWVLIGSADPVRPPSYRNGVYTARPRVSVFTRCWAAFRDATWEVEGDRPLARLLPLPPDDRTRLACEPLVGRADMEVRYADVDGSPALAEVLFPTEMPVCEAKAFLAAEAGEVRFGVLGPSVWHEADGVITCCWPVCEADVGTVETADVGDGVRECFTQAGLTVAVSFAIDAGWTRESAAEWLTARTTHLRTAVVR